jgi:uncharacterized iron-regulated membrane protein
MTPSATGARRAEAPSWWQGWVHHPEKFRLRQVIFQVHFWIGTIAGVHALIMSLTGSVIVYREELFQLGIPIERIVDLHTNLAAGEIGRTVNMIGAACLIVLCLTGAVIWWPGLVHWRRSMTVEWRATFPRINWDLHSALGFWGFLFVLMWGVSGLYLSAPAAFATVVNIDPAGTLTYRLSQLHVGRFTSVTKVMWSVLGLAPAVLAFTGVFICCRRIMFNKPSSPKHYLP